ncbi:MAG TPA: excinuclease ABC subunit A, partial [Actinomycetota bacterium]|nr:excinuclease ABC subunit A [Actinomycetota bacterium]
GEYERLLKDLAAKGFARARIDGEVRELSEPIRLDRYYKHTIEVVVDRLVAKPGIRRRLADSVETALQLAEGMAAVAIQTDGKEDIIPFSENLACVHCGLSFDELAPRNFSFNSPYGACETCDGLGTRLEVDPELVVPDKDLAITEGAIAPWASTRLEYWNRVIAAVADAHGFSLKTPWRKLPDEAREVVLYGSDKDIYVRYRNRYGRQRAYWTVFEGVIPNIERRHEETDSDHARWRWEQFMREVPCRTCKGARLRPESLAVTIDGVNISQLTDMSIVATLRFLEQLEPKLSERERMIGERLLKEIRGRLGFLVDVGLDYLTLGRSAGTLAGGEAQRIRLATQIGSGLVGVLYILDEPSIGLHQRDNKRLIDTLVRLRDLGNTLIVVEHDESTIRTADWIVAIGPGAGEAGGEVVYAGPVEGIETTEGSITGAYLAGRRTIPMPEVRRRPGGRWLEVRGAREHNLKGIDVDIPRESLTVITGLSGSGKSSLAFDTIYAEGQRRYVESLSAYARQFLEMMQKPDVDHIEGLSPAISIEQKTTSRNPRSTVATVTEMYDYMRLLWARVGVPYSPAPG